MQYIISKSLKFTISPKLLEFWPFQNCWPGQKFQISHLKFLKSHSDLIAPNWSTTKWFSINAPHWLFKFGIYSKLHEFVTFWNFFVETPQNWHCLIQNFQNARNSKHTNTPFTEIQFGKEAVPELARVQPTCMGYWFVGYYWHLHFSPIDDLRKMAFFKWHFFDVKYIKIQ